MADIYTNSRQNQELQDQILDCSSASVTQDSVCFHRLPVSAVTRTEVSGSLSKEAQQCVHSEQPAQPNSTEVLQLLSRRDVLETWKQLKS